MLYAPTRIVNPILLGIDPSSTTIGYSVVEYDIASNLFIIIEAGSYCASLPYHLTCLLQTSDEKYRRLSIIKDFVSRKLSEYSFSEVFCEDTYFKNSTEAYASLLGCIQAVKDATVECSYILPITLLRASSVKSGLGVQGDSGDKSMMRDALQSKESYIIPPTPGYIDSLDQHAIDAVCIAVYGGMIAYGVNNGITKKKKRYSSK